jgi:hypothetical protein
MAMVVYGYDFAIPDGRGICGYGPWLKPTFDLRKFPRGAARQEVVKAMLQQFATMLTSLATQAKVSARCCRILGTTSFTRRRRALRNSRTFSIGN